VAAGGVLVVVAVAVSAALEGGAVLGVEGGAEVAVGVAGGVVPVSVVVPPAVADLQAEASESPARTLPPRPMPTL